LLRLAERGLLLMMTLLLDGVVLVSGVLTKLFRFEAMAKRCAGCR
jgi:hypothetical protein